MGLMQEPLTEIEANVLHLQIFSELEILCLGTKEIEQFVQTCRSKNTKTESWVKKSNAFIQCQVKTNHLQQVCAVRRVLWICLNTSLQILQKK